MQPAADFHILVVEDDIDARNALTDLLIDAGYLPLAVNDGVEALNHLRDGNRPALIILDLILPRIDGWRFLSIAAETPEFAAIPVIVCSSADTKAHPPGVSREYLLTKPVEIEHLLSLVARHCTATFEPAGAGIDTTLPPVRKKKPRTTTTSRRSKNPPG